MTEKTAAEPLYPDDHDLGRLHEWRLPRQDSPEHLTVEAQFIGLGTSQEDMHSHSGPVLTDDRRCLACRWFEARMFLTKDEGQRYLLYKVGASNIPGEIDMIRYRYVKDAYEAVLCMSVPHNTDPKARFLGAPVKDMFTTAGAFDDAIGQALTHYRISTSTHKAASRAGWSS